MAEHPTETSGERLHKVMARAGVASRRQCEDLIRQGRVQVNGRIITELGTRVVEGKDEIAVDGRPLHGPERRRYILLNKPRGYVTTVHDPEGRPKVIDLVAHEKERLFPVGRLDWDTQGLLLLTNDGQLTHRLLHPAREVPKTYVARVRGVPPARGALAAMRSGIMLEDGLTAPAAARLLSVAAGQATLEITIHEGRNRQVRRMCEAVGHPVLSLCRVRFGPLELGGLPSGGYRDLTQQEVDALYRAVGQRPERVASAAPAGHRPRQDAHDPDTN